MKKDLLYTIFSFVLSVFLMSCQKSEAPVPGVGVERQNFITHYFMPDTLKVDPGVLDEDDPAYPYSKYEYFVRLVCLNYIPGDDTVMMSKYSDTAFCGRFWTSVPALGKVITDVTLTAIDDYNANYPAGSCLDDIAYVSYCSYYPYISRGYVKYPNLYVNGYEDSARACDVVPGQTGDELYDMINRNGLPGVGSVFYWDIRVSELQDVPLAYPLPWSRTFFYSGEHDPDNLFPDTYRGLDATVAMLRFSEKPSSENVKVEVTMTFDDGTSLSCVLVHA